jgi:hypothetical protein
MQKGPLWKFEILLVGTLLTRPPPPSRTPSVPQPTLSEEPCEGSRQQQQTTVQHTQVADHHPSTQDPKAATASSNTSHRWANQSHLPTILPLPSEACVMPTKPMLAHGTPNITPAATLDAVLAYPHIEPKYDHGSCPANQYLLRSTQELLTTQLYTNTLLHRLAHLAATEPPAQPIARSWAAHHRPTGSSPQPAASVPAASCQPPGDRLCTEGRCNSRQLATCAAAHITMSPRDAEVHAGVMRPNASHMPRGCDAHGVRCEPHSREAKLKHQMAGSPWVPVFAEHAARTFRKKKKRSQGGGQGPASSSTQALTRRFRQ